MSAIADQARVQPFFGVSTASLNHGGPSNQPVNALLRPTFTQYLFRTLMLNAAGVNETVEIVPVPMGSEDEGSGSGSGSSSSSKASNGSDTAMTATIVGVGELVLGVYCFLKCEIHA